MSEKQKRILKENGALDPLFALNKITHTSERYDGGFLYTISDYRVPELNGLKIYGCFGKYSWHNGE